MNTCIEYNLKEIIVLENINCVILSFLKMYRKNIIFVTKKIDLLQILLKCQNL